MKFVNVRVLSTLRYATLRLCGAARSKARLRVRFQLRWAANDDLRWIERIHLRGNVQIYGIYKTGKSGTFKHEDEKIRSTSKGQKVLRGEIM